MAKLVEDRIEELAKLSLKDTLQREKFVLIAAIYDVLVNEYSCETNEECEEMQSDVERGVKGVIDKLLKGFK